MRDDGLLKRIEHAAIWAWPPAETRSIMGWILCWGGPSTRRLRSVRTLAFDATARLPRAIDEVELYWSKLGQPSCFHLTDLVAPTDLDATLEARGYALVTPTSVLVAQASQGVAADPTVELHTQASQAVMNAICDTRWSDAGRMERAAIFARIRRPHRFALAWVDGEPAAAGLCVRDGELAGIFAMRTQPRFARRGLAGRILARLAGWAADEGARQLYLQVEADNEPALAVYGKAGFQRIYGYHYRERAVT